MDPVPTSLRRTSAMSGPLLSDPLEKLHSQTDSFLTAARLVRGGWTEEGKKTGRQFSYFNYSARQPPLSRSHGNQGPKCAEVCLKDPKSMWAPLSNSRRTAEDKEICSERKAKEAEQTTGGAFSANRQAGRQTGLRSQAGGVCVWASGCRTTYRQFRKFRAPKLPVIAEM